MGLCCQHSDVPRFRGSTDLRSNVGRGGKAHAISDVLYDRLCDFCHSFGNGWPDLQAGILHYSELFFPGRPNLLRLYTLGREHS